MINGEKKENVINKQFIIEWVERIKYCGYCKERDEVFYQYEDSMEQ